MNLSSTIQSRVRQLFGLTGAPAIQGITSVQPVAVVAGYAPDRQPQMESGDQLVRNFAGGMTKAAVALNYSVVGIRASEETSLLWIRRIGIINETAAGASYAFGRGPNISAISFGKAFYTDVRLPAVDIGGGVAQIHSGHQVGYPLSGGRDVTIPAFTGKEIEVDYILVYPPLESLLVTTWGVNQALPYVWFEGIVFNKDE